MVTALLIYGFRETIDVQNLSTPEIDATLFVFLEKHLQKGKLVDAVEFLEIDNQLKYIEFADKPETETFIQIIADIPKDLLGNKETRPEAIAGYLSGKISPDNLIYKSHWLEGNDKYFIVKMIRLEESFI